MSDENNNQQPLDESKKDAVEQALDRLKPLATQIGVGGIMGYCTGMAMKKVGKVVATVLGLGFVALQSAAYAGYIQINWKQIGDDVVVKRIDASGDGKIDMEDVKLWWKKFKAIMTYQLPDATGFSLGFLAGVKYG